MENPTESVSFEFLPEPVIELILTMVPEEDILACNLVCRTWKRLISRKSYWKKRYQEKKINWYEIPEHIRDKAGGWMILYAQYRYQILSKNYIHNPSGHRRFGGWVISATHRNMWLVEQVPDGCEPLPSSDFFGRKEGCCFVTSFDWSSKCYTVDLWREGLKLKPGVMKLILPFQIKCSQMYAARFDCGGQFNWELRLLDSHWKVIRFYKQPTIDVPPSEEWKTAEYGFKFESKNDFQFRDLRYIEFIHEGKDTQFWAGHFGTKFARSCVTIELLEPDVAVAVEETKEQGDEKKKKIPRRRMGGLAKWLRKRKGR
ncbi:unnamed protein product [Orchesella dallaii]|uniref:F-box only protein 6 n=1 Tax=Orchesella dallaii TaxID=48710 RepID=A0ABP1RWM2_9HEXA